MFKPGQTVYFIANNSHVVQATVIKVSGNLYTLRFDGKGIRLKGHRLFATKEEAEAQLPKRDPLSRYGPYWDH